MSEELYGVSFGIGATGAQNYNGRDRDGRIKVSGDGTFMTRECAESLCRLLKAKYPVVHVVELTRGDRDDMVAGTLAELGEKSSLEILVGAIKECISFGNTQQEILAAVNQVVGAI
jgi:hypothetical protein